MKITKHHNQNQHPFGKLKNGTMCLASADQPKFSHHFLGIGFQHENKNLELVEPFRIKKSRGVSHCGLAIYIKNIFRQKKNFGN
jgi:hypothetical protein